MLLHIHVSSLTSSKRSPCLFTFCFYCLLFLQCLGLVFVQDWSHKKWSMNINIYRHFRDAFFVNFHPHRYFFFRNQEATIIRILWDVVSLCIRALFFTFVWVIFVFKTLQTLEPMIMLNDFYHKKDFCSFLFIVSLCCIITSLISL